ncbi:uncharacterized protein LOC112569683 [Pomacea canaliculata]|uniref:uncharacterized protein LOC112569683 n=1 Tax=Pomacea canaliculata TaxID=400727 RepID=UPI000D731271|nr:uncharacterized protein LOC112569683 [Pomacea canaliculata]
METRESSPKIGCTIRNQKDPYQIQCAFSTDPEDKRDFSVYFYYPDGRQELMVRCTHNEGYDCAVAHEGLTITEDLIISVSETFSEQNGSFVCRNGGLPLDDFPCFYSGNSVKPQVSYGIEENGSNTLDKPEDCGTKDLAVTIGAVLGVVVLIQFLVIGFLLFKQYTLKKRVNKYKSRKETESFIVPEQNVHCVVPTVSIKDYVSENENESSEKKQINETRWSFLSNDDLKPDEPLNAVTLWD